MRSLENVGLDYSNAAALGMLLGGSGGTALRACSLERNNLNEAALLVIATALLRHRGECALTELSVAHQKTTISTEAVNRLLDAQVVHEPARL